MKKLVPDPPPVLSIRPGLTHDEAIRTATEHLDTVISALDALPDQRKARDQSVLEGARVNVRIGKALLKIAQAKSTISVPIT